MPETATTSKPSLPSGSMIIPLLLWDPVGKSADLTVEDASQFFLVAFGGDREAYPGGASGRCPKDGGIKQN